MITRRQFVKTVAIAGAALSSAATTSRGWAAKQYQPEMADDGLYKQPWFMETFLVLREDLEEAATQGKRLAIIWEQRGCPYCKELHLVNLARPDINDYIHAHFGMLQLNIWGAREVTDFDGETLGERELARKWGVHFTPTIQFFPETVEKGVAKSGADLEVARMPGYFKPFHFITMFEFVQARAYERLGFQQYLQEKLATLQAKDVKPEVW